MKARNETEKAGPLFCYAGGKRSMLKHILPLIGGHRCYCEPFFGAGAVFFAKARSEVEVINDINGELVSLYRCVKHHGGEMERELSGLLNSRQEFMDYLAQRGLTEIQRSARYLFRRALCFGGKADSFGTVKTQGGGAAKSLTRLRVLLQRVSARLEKVVIEHRSWQQVVRAYDAPGTLFFLDPPYLNCDGTSYDGWKRPQMEELEAALRKLKGSFILTADGGESAEVFASWTVKRIERSKGNAGVNGAEKRYSEIIVTPPGVRGRARKKQHLV